MNSHEQVLEPSAFPVRTRGRQYEDFQVGQRLDHHWGRTLSAGDATLFATATLAYNPLYFNAEHAREEGHPDLVVHPLLALCTVVGLSVEDLSEAGGPFLGIDDLTFHRAVHPGDTLSSASTVLAKRPSGSQPGFGIVTWRTEGRDQHGDLVVAFTRSNLVVMREAQS
ncbi:MaoC family dehydratase [Streptomyces sp. NPDC004539]|uniref:MaoC family dehydratase n=1 Tax=Streptomyces sp. NPDC004539 TaxID=3154280 RepID=UPI0033A75A82